MKELVQKVIQWAEDRNIIDGAKKTDQLHKLYQECGELSDNLCKGKDARDDIGDITVVLIILAKQSGFVFDSDQKTYTSSTNAKIMYFELMSNVDCIRYDIRYNCLAETLVSCAYKSLLHICHALDYDVKECLEIAYNDIKDRKGEMIDGVFVKEADL